MIRSMKLHIPSTAVPSIEEKDDVLEQHVFRAENGAAKIAPES